MTDIYSVRKFQKSDADDVSKLIIKTLRTTNIKDYSVEHIENHAKTPKNRQKSAKLMGFDGR